MVRYIKRTVNGRKISIPVRTRQEVKNLRNPSNPNQGTSSNERTSSGSTTQTSTSEPFDKPSPSNPIVSSKPKVQTSSTLPGPGMTNYKMEQRLVVGKPSEGSPASEIIKGGGSIRFSTGGGQAPQATKVTLGNKPSRIQREEKEVEVKPQSFGNGIQGIRTNEGITLSSTRTNIQTGQKDTMLFGRNINQFPIKGKQEIFSLTPRKPSGGVLEARDTPNITRSNRLNSAIQGMKTRGFNLFTKAKAGTQDFLGTQRKDFSALNEFVPTKVKTVAKDTGNLLKFSLVDPFIEAKDLVYGSGAKIGITPESIGKGLSKLSSKQEVQAVTLTGDKFGLTIDQRSQALEGASTSFLALPRDKPLQAAIYFALPEVIGTVSNLGKIGAGKTLLKAAKVGKVSPGFVSSATVIGETFEPAVGVAFGVGITKSKLDQFRTADGAKAKGEVLGETLFEGTAITAGALSARGGGRLGEIYEAKVKNPLSVAGSPTYSSKANIEFAEDIGQIGLDLSGLKSETIIPKRKPAFSKIEGATSRDIGELNRFFSGRTDRFVKGSLEQASKLDRDLFEEFIDVKGGSISDLDLGSRGGAEPKVSFKTDVKDFSESRNIVGARRLDVFEGIQGQSFSEQSFRKASGGFDIGPEEMLDPQFGRLIKDPRDLVFNVIQGRREGIKVKTSSQRNLEKALLGELEGVTLPVKQAEREAGILRNLFEKEKLGTKDIFGNSKFKQKKSGELFTDDFLIKRRKSSSSSSRAKSPSSFYSPKPSSSSSLSRSISKSISGSSSPSFSPSKSPSFSPSKSPSFSPSTYSSFSPSKSSSKSPSLYPSFSPSTSPSKSPSLYPSITTTPRRPAAIPIFRFKPGKVKKLPQYKQKDRGYRYNPSVVAIQYNIHGKKPKKLTGLEIRKL